MTTNEITKHFEILTNFKEEYNALNGKKTSQGIIFKCALKTPIISIADGIVMEVKRDDVEFGNSVLIWHYGWYSYYAHLSLPIVEKGERLKGGKLVGSAGRTGINKKHHQYQLYLKIKINEKYVNPLPYLLGEKTPPEPEVDIEPNGDIYYTVKAEETLKTIAKKFYTEPEKWVRISTANEQELNNKQEPLQGKRLFIP